MTPREKVVRPRVTVLMSVHNGGRFLASAIESILGQSYPHFEFLIINDGSTDGSRDVMLSYKDARIRVIENPENLGLTKSLNRGLAAARAELVARQDADDLAHEDRLARQVAFMDVNPQIVLAGTQARVIDERGRPRAALAQYRAQSELGVQWQLLFLTPFVHSSVIFRREAIWGRLGGYDETWRQWQDFELWSRVLAQYRARNLPDTLVDWRAHGASITGNPSPESAAARRPAVARSLQVQHENLRRIVGHGCGPSDWPELWTAINVPWLVGHPSRPGRVLGGIRDLLRAFDRRYVDAAGDPEIRRHLASALTYAACYLASRDRPTAILAYAWACWCDPWLARAGSAKLAALLLFGESATPLVRNLRRNWPRGSLGWRRRDLTTNRDQDC